jgi:hypothetical protein
VISRAGCSIQKFIFGVAFSPTSLIRPASFGGEHASALTSGNSFVRSDAVIGIGSFLGAKTELTQMRQRQTWNLRHRHCLSRILRHPDRELRQRAIGLTDGHSRYHGYCDW